MLRSSRLLILDFIKEPLNSIFFLGQIEKLLKKILIKRLEMPMYLLISLGSDVRFLISFSLFQKDMRPSSGPKALLCQGVKNNESQ